jgi:microcystin degradation protein MlrC
MTRLFIAGLDTETNSFSPIPTDEAAFRGTLLAYGDATERPLNPCSAQLALWRTRAEAIGMGVHEGLCAVAEPGGPIPRAVHEYLRDRMIEDLQAASPDMVLLALHGAAIAEGTDDVEGDLLMRIRAIVGPDVFVGATLDPHAHLTDAMLTHASALIAYREYPHTDISARADDMFDLMLGADARVVRPVMAMWDCRMIAAFPTQVEPMRGFVDSLAHAERKGPKILSLSLIHGFAHGDVPEAGARMLAIADSDAPFAASLAQDCGRRFVALRDHVTPRFLDMEAALARLQGAPTGEGPLVLADAGDNPGGGAPGDATFLLTACLERGITGVAFAMIWDPEAVRLCDVAGVGAVLDLSLGGRFGAASGPPVVLHGASVQALGGNLMQRFGDVLMPMGKAARIEVDGITIIINDHRTQVFDPACLSALGGDPHDYRAIIVKSLNHFAGLFAPIAREIAYVASPGATSPAYAEIPYRRRATNYWPRVADPWAVQGDV